MTIRIEFNPRLDKEQIKKTIVKDDIEERIVDAINRNEGGLRITNYKGEESKNMIFDKYKILELL